MRSRVRAWLLLLLGGGAVASLIALAAPGVLRRAERPGVRLRDVGPRLVSNQTSQPLALYGEGFFPGLRLSLGPPFSRELPVTVIDERHAYARLPADLPLPTEQVQAQVQLVLRGERGESTPLAITVVNDTGFPDPIALALSEDGRFVYAASPTNDRVYILETATRAVRAQKVGDGPSALATWRDWLVVAHLFSGELRLVRPGGGPGAQIEERSIPAPAYAAGLAVDAGSSTAYVAEHARDTVTAIDLESGRVLWTARVLPNPRELAVAGDLLAVGSLQAGQIQLLDRASGQERARVQPDPGTAILGGRTEKYGRYIMGGKAPRAILWTRRCGLLVSSIGPNIGPNPGRMEVSMNGGVSIVGLEGTPRVPRHVGFGAGVPEGMALDEAAGLLYVADIALGRVRVLDVRRLCAGDDAAARAALLQEIPVPPTDVFPRVRPPADFGISGRAGPELHSGPRALALAPDGATLYALNRFTGTVAVLDVRDAARGQVRGVGQIPLADMITQPGRRLGQVLYYADLGRTGMSCDACHLEGHTGGVFFEKTRPLRIYRSTTLRGSRETPPYFTPASTRSLAQTAQEVGGRNRFHNPDPSPAEIELLALFNATLAPLPNPFAGPDGAPREELTLPDGRKGRPRRGLALFEGRAGCAACHPAPHFTTDQDPSTRGRTYDVGTPRALALREEMQDLLPPSFPPPSLLGGWDVFPLLTSGAAGFVVRPDGSLGIESDFPLRSVLEAMGAKHGGAATLTPGERDDLLAYLLSL